MAQTTKKKSPGGRTPTGTAEWLPNRTGGGQYVCRFPGAGGKRPRLKMLGDDGRPLFTDRERDFEAAHAKARKTYKRAMQMDARDVVVSGAKKQEDLPATVEGFGEYWTSGALFARFGKIKRLKIKKSWRDDRNRLRKYVYPYIGKMHLADVTEETIGGVLVKARRDFFKRRKRNMRPATERHIYMVLHRTFDLAIKPGKFIKENPVSEDLLPEKGSPKIYAFLYPEELVALLGCTDIPIARRVYYAIAVYTGLRKGSLKELIWRSVDPKRGTIRSLISKTDEYIGPQLFSMSDPDLPGLRSLITILVRYRKYLASHEYLGDPADAAPIIRHKALRMWKKDAEASTLRMDLECAGIKRPELFAKSEKEEPLRFHDLRATFVTWAHRVGKGEGWISDRTGHISKAVMVRYIRAARNIGDLEIEPFPDISKAIPELAKIAA